jgi:serine phosphatase RsbU (regulator of sigma subunit)
MRAESEATILLVDDQPHNLVALESILHEFGHRLVKAGSGAEALRYLLDHDVALILLDVQMPGMDGFETAELIRRRERSRQTPIIFLTAYDQRDAQILKGYELGAVDFVVKPLVPQILRCKVSVLVDLFEKTEQIVQQEHVLREMERIEYERRLADAAERLESERLRAEIRVAREIQQRFFPAAPLPLPGLDIGGASYPADATGGDYFDYVPLQDGSLAIAIGDVSGHGLGPALLMAETRAYLRAFSLTRTDVREILRLVNQALVRDSPDDRFATLLLARLDLENYLLEYASAGHPTGYILDGSGEVQAKLESTGMPLGILPELELDPAEPIRLETGQVILMLTDGIIEAHGDDNTLFGVERALELLRAQRHRAGREIVDALYRTISDFCRGRNQFDDMTAVLIKVNAA